MQHHHSHHARKALVRHPSAVLWARRTRCIAAERGMQRQPPPQQPSRTSPGHDPDAPPPRRARARCVQVEAAHKARQFTDVNSFTLRCAVCQLGLKGEKEATVHAKETGHTNFAEY